MAEKRMTVAELEKARTFVLVVEARLALSLAEVEGVLQDINDAIAVREREQRDALYSLYSAHRDAGCSPFVAYKMASANVKSAHDAVRGMK